MSDGPTYLVGVGATKAGTSWLHAALRRHDECHLRSLKELHFFDTLHTGDFARQIALREAELAALEARGPGARPVAFRRKRRDLRDWLAVLGQGEVAAYLAYLTARRGARRVVADITPAYALLPEVMLRRIATMAADVRLLYLLRDPVARLWSQVRMLARRRTGGGAGFAAQARALMDRALAGAEPCAVARGDYTGALARLDAAVDPRRLLVLFHDQLFGGDGPARLARFLGIAPLAADVTRRVHAGVPLDLPEDQHARAVALLRPQYVRVEERFGHLPASWRASLARGGVA